MALHEREIEMTILANVFLQNKHFKPEPSEEETEYAKWEDYKTLVLKMRKHVATIADFDIAEVGDNVESNEAEVKDAESNAVEVGNDVDDVSVRGV